jgi:hypothetical protein
MPFNDEVNPQYLQYLTSKSIPHISLWVGAISAWQPVYLPNCGNASLIYLSDGSGLYVGWSAQRVEQEVNQFYDIKVESRRGKYKQLMGGSQTMPIVIHSRNTVYVGLKTRSRPQSKHDGVTGHIATKHIKCVHPRTMGVTQIELISGQMVQVEFGENTVNHHIRDANTFHKLLFLLGSNESNFI